MSEEKQEKSNSYEYESKMPIRSVEKFPEIKNGSSTDISSLKIKSCPLKSTVKLPASVLPKENQSADPILNPECPEIPTSTEVQVPFSVSEDEKLKSSGKGDLQGNRIYTVSNEFKDEKSETEIIAEGGDAKQITTEVKIENEKSCEILFFKEQNQTEIEIEPKKVLIPPSRFSGFRALLNHPYMTRVSQIIDVYPRTLLFIPDLEKPGVYISNFTIENTTRSPLAYKVVGNRSAINHYIFEPMLGVIEPQGKIRVDLATKESISKNVIGGFSQFRALRDILGVRAIESIYISNETQIFNFWKIAERNHSDLITTVTIPKILVLEPCNTSILTIIDEGPEREFLQNYFWEKYQNEIIPEIMRENMKKKQSLVITTQEDNIAWQRQKLRDSIDIVVIVLLLFTVIWYALPDTQQQEAKPKEIESYFRKVMKLLGLSEESMPNAQPSEGNITMDTESFKFYFLNLLCFVGKFLARAFLPTEGPPLADIFVLHKIKSSTNRAEAQ